MIMEMGKADQFLSCQIFSMMNVHSPSETKYHQVGPPPTMDGSSSTSTEHLLKIRCRAIDHLL